MDYSLGPLQSEVEKGPKTGRRDGRERAGEGVSDGSQRRGSDQVVYNVAVVHVDGDERHQRATHQLGQLTPHQPAQCAQPLHILVVPEEVMGKSKGR